MSQNKTELYNIVNKAEQGIEWISYFPKEKKHKTPIFFQHGMWHGAWCWAPWQAILAELGWESHAISLPAHGNSSFEKSCRWMGLGTYLNVIKEQIEKLDQKPIYIGHSMGGALGQHYLKKVGDDLPAMVLVASWTSHSTWMDGMMMHLKRDFWGTYLSGLLMSTSPFIRNAERAASMLITENAIFSNEALFERLNHESGIVLNQHNPPFWQPLKNPKTPILWLGAEKDAVISQDGAKKSAQFYGADFIEIENAGHNLMMEHNYQETACLIDDWLKQKLG